jgi:hypothetical protein
MNLLLKISAGILLAAVVIAAWNTWRRDAEDRAFSVACLGNDYAAELYALGRTSDADIYRCIDLRARFGER